jgi:sulfur-oxidizing protein SoxA
MNKLIALGLGLSLGLTAALPGVAHADAEADRKAFADYFYKKFPKTPKDDFINGVYAIDKGAREQWESIEEFPPYELPLETGETLFNTPFANGKGYADCFENGGKGIRQNFPYFDEKTEQVRTLEQDINACRVTNGEKPLKWKKGKLAAISAYMAYTSRGKKVNITIPNAKAEAAYEDGKQFFYAKRGQFNFSCADCHVYSAGMNLRADILSPALGHTTHFPVYRAKWGSLGTMHRRYAGCNKQVRAKPFKAQSEQYRNLEYFHSYMSNGLDVNGPGVRK